MHSAFPIFIAFLLLASQACARETVVDNNYKFTLIVPGGFAPSPELTGAAPNVVHAFVLGDPTDEKLDVFLIIEDMRGTIGRERLKPDAMPPGFHGRLFTTEWQGFELDAVEIPEKTGDIKTITYNVSIPLKRSAIQLKLFGPSDREAELKSILAQTLAGLEGESNWMSAAESATPASSVQDGRIILLAIAILIVIGGLVILWLVSRAAPRGTVLAIAAGIYFAGVLLPGIRVPEILVLRGSLKMLGVAGGILGIVDLVRKRKPRDVDAAQQDAEDGSG